VKLSPMVPIRILDISSLLGYKAGSIILTNVQGTNSSLTVLINPHAALAGDFNGDGIVDSANSLTVFRARRRRQRSSCQAESQQPTATSPLAA
jgi:hypothetical protein